MQNLAEWLVNFGPCRHFRDEDGTTVLEEWSRQAVLDTYPEAADMELITNPLDYLEHRRTGSGPTGTVPLLGLFRDDPDYPWKRRYRQKGGPTSIWFRPEEEEEEDVPRPRDLAEPTENRNPRPVYGPRPGLQTEDTQGVSSPQNGPEQVEVL